MFEKMGLSLSKSDEYDIHIFGQNIGNLPMVKNITFHIHKCPPKLSLTRITTPIKILFNSIKVKPDILICNSIDLLLLMFLNKILFGTKLVYDIRENYNFNITHQSNYTGLKSSLIKSTIKLIESITGRFYDHFFLAEKSYQSEIQFTNPNQTTVLQNTFSNRLYENSKNHPSPSNKPYILYSGTIAEEYGIRDLIQWKKKSKTSLKLIIAGFCANKALLKWIRNEIINHDIQIIGGNHLIPHTDIINLIKHASLSVMPYQNNKSVVRCMPTKVFEYTFFKLPILASPYGIWTDFITNHSAGLTVDFNSYDDVDLKINQILNQETPLYYKTPTKNNSWESIEEKVFINNISILINR